MRRALPLLVLVLLAPAPPPSEPVAAASRLLSVLRPSLRRQCVLPLGHADRLRWRYTPGGREGVSLKEMNPAEREAALRLVAAGLSDHGYEKAKGVVELEGILRGLETFGGLLRDPERYWITIFGEPSDATPWAWRFEGHHVSLSFSSATGRIVASTPAFFGANPARVPDGPRRGWRLLAAEEDIARRLLASLNEEQRRSAVISPSAPADILFGPGRGEAPPTAGIPAARLTESQQALLVQLVDEYLGNARPEVARREWSRARSAGLDRLRFAWAGGSRPGEGHYYRVQGPTLVIEYDNTQDGANHVHSVWRDPENDFGGDLLRRHYAESPHHHDFRASGRSAQERSAGSPR